MTPAYLRRQLPLQGGINFRDFGGYAAADGRRVKWGKLFRAGHLADLTDDDHAHLDTLDIGAICDFRTDAENAEHPPHLPQDIQSRLIRLNIWPKSARSVEHMIRGLAQGTLSEAEVYDAQNIVYREFISDFSAAYAQMIHHIIAAQGRAALIHCAGGKDRTGVGAALILRLLGVSDADIFADYALTNHSQAALQRIRVYAQKGAAMAGVTDAPAVDALFNRFLPPFGARADSLAAALEAVHDLAGSFDGYFRDVLRVTPAQRDQLQQWYLEPA